MLSSMVPRIGLYYPYVHFKNESWLKVAALYWPMLARIIPDGYDVQDNATTRALIEQLDFILDISPDSAKGNAAVTMLRTITESGSGSPERFEATDESLLPLRVQDAAELLDTNTTYSNNWHVDYNDSIKEYITNDFDAIRPGIHFEALFGNRQYLHHQRFGIIFGQRKHQFLCHDGVKVG